MTLRIQYTAEQRIFTFLEWIIGGTAVVALVVFIGDYGWNLRPEYQALIEVSYPIIGGIFLIGLFAQFLIRRDRWEYARANKVKYVLSVLLLIEILALHLDRWYGRHNLEHIHQVLFKSYIFLHVVRKFLRFSQYLAQWKVSPARFIVGSFAGVILTGAVLLWGLPKATTTPITFINALFTSTSAVCVTGLIVVDTAKAFTTTGQIIILGLIQIGGLGIMTITTFFALLVGQRMSGREQVLMGNYLSTEQLSQLGLIIRAILLMTAGIEACGVLSLYLRWKQFLPSGLAFYTAVFHGISAFCNAGFSTFSANLMDYVADAQISLTICGLIILGGLGFSTLRNLKSLSSPGSLRQRIARLTVQSKLSLLVTALLLASGTLLFLGIEHGYLLKDLSRNSRVLAAFFQSVTCRTAGFNTIDISQLRTPAMMVSIILMFIGVAPGSTGGGIKVTTFAILVCTVFSLARGKTRIELFRRTIPVKMIYQTLLVVTIYLVVVIVVSFVLLLIEAPRWRLIDFVFETVSAIGTVGLSTGQGVSLSGYCTWIGKLLIIFTMFLGRVGAFTLALAIGQKSLTESYKYPEEEVQIG
jgi:trk system potassium uptake protein TrkH